MPKPMINYIGTKKIKAMPMTKVAYNQMRGWETPDNEDKTEMGYLVEYPNSVPNHADFEGYISWSPKAVFEESYSKYDALDFSKALELLKENVKVARAGWNGKSMFLMTIDPYDNSQFRVQETNFLVGTLAPYIAMKTADNKLVPWLASQTDLLAEDWQVVL